MLTNPTTIPPGLNVELSRARVKPGQSAEADRWMQMLNDRVDECVATLDRERMALEIVFRLEEDGVEHLYWVSIFGAAGRGLDVSIPIDRDHEAAARWVKEPGWVDAEPQFLLLPDSVRESVVSWALRPPENKMAVAGAIHRASLTDLPAGAPELGASIRAGFSQAARERHGPEPSGKSPVRGGRPGTVTP